MYKNQKPLKRISTELIGGFLNLIIGNLYTKVGLSILLIVSGFAAILSPVKGEVHKPAGFYVAGGILLALAFYLILKRYKELKKTFR